jgi:sortase A
MNNTFLHIGHEPPENKPSGKKTIKTVLKDAGRQIFVSMLILVVAFVAMNWRALYINVKYKIDVWTGTQQESSLEEMVSTTPKPKPKLADTDKSTETQVKSIPDLFLEITPPDTRLVIPRINQNIPVVRVSSEHLINKDWGALESEMQEALKYGVVHYPGTSLPNQTGNIVITGHSSYFPWDPGRFKDVFALLHEVVEGDKIAMYHNQKKYIYEVSNIEVVLPSNLEVLKQTPANKLTLITCTPIGTNLKRLVVTAELMETQ